ncbi:MAG TPA: di-heme oxidoredictase family protein [Bryobacteraceae bacterium]|nr:di-heme oxidoredictase family protein [Bryobacteraceae bacterium]
MAAFSLLLVFRGSAQDQSEIGREVAVPHRLQDGQEFDLSILELIRYGKKLFEARFTSEEGAGRPLTKGTGAALSDPGSPLTFPRNNNRISGPESNSCAGCHNQPISGGAGDLSTNVFVLGQRFDFATFNPNDVVPTRGGIDERGTAVTLQSIANSRSTIDMFGSGYYEMLARQITADLQNIRNNLRPGQSVQLTSKGISFGVLARNIDGSWNTSGVQGLAPQSLASSDAQNPPSLLILPFHQSASTVSLRVFTNDAFNQHHGMQSTERFGIGTDPDGDGVVNELTRADITACTLFQATLPVPVRSVPRDSAAQQAAQEGEKSFRQIGCASCHIPALPLDNKGWIYTEPGPYNPTGNLQLGEAAPLSVDLNRDDLPQPRLKAMNGTVMVPLYTDFKLHDICRGPDDPNVEVLNAKRPEQPIFSQATHNS